MDRIYGYDVLTALKNLLSANLNTQIGLIKAARGDAGVLNINKITTGYSERQYPECLISLQDSTPKNDDLNFDIDNTPEVFPVEVVVIFRDNTQNPYLRQEIYIEALQKTLQGYSSEQITWILLTGSIRAKAYTESKETLIVGGVSIDIKTL